MANNVTNKLRFDKCSKERCREILEAIQIDRIGLGSIDFNKIIPEPYFPSDQDCINWRIKNWDTKWEAYGYRDGIQYDEDKNRYQDQPLDAVAVPATRHRNHLLRRT